MSIWKLSNVRQQKASFSWGHNAGSGRCVIAGGYVAPGNVDTIDKFSLNSSDGAFTPSNVSVDVVTQFESTAQAPPISSGKFVYFPFHAH